MTDGLVDYVAGGRRLGEGENDFLADEINADPQEK
jgi:hypothetical protein